jgi:hypothetical protein
MCLHGGVGGSHTTVCRDFLFASEILKVELVFLTGSDLHRRWYQQLWHVIDTLEPVRFVNSTNLSIHGS